MTELDRIAKRQVAQTRAREAREKRSAAALEAERLLGLEGEIHALANEIILLLEVRADDEGDDGWSPVTVLSHRFPPLGDLFGDWKAIKAGWDLGFYGSQPIVLLSDGRICWCGRISSLIRIRHCVPLIHERLSSLRTHLSAGKPGRSWVPS